MGLVNGKGDGTVYDPEGAITRQEAACLLARAYEKLDPEDHRVALYSSYTDYSAMAPGRWTAFRPWWDWASWGVPPPLR